MILVAAAIVFGVAALLVTHAFLDGRAIRGDLERFVAWKAEEHERLDAERRELVLQRQSLDEVYAERERMWAEERRALLDRIQDPHAVVMARLESEAEREAETDATVDKKYALSPSGAVEWDPDLAPLPGVDEPVGGE